MNMDGEAANNKEAVDGSGGVGGAPPQDQSPEEAEDLQREDVDANDDDSRSVPFVTITGIEVEQETMCTKCCKSIGLGCCCRIFAAWPRSSAILFGVAAPLFLLIAISVVFGHFFADLESHGEIEANNEIFAAQAAVSFQEQLVGNITINLPRMCTCTYLHELQYEEKINEQQAEYEQCLEQQRLQLTPSSSPSLQPSNQPTSNGTINNGTDEESIPLLPILDSPNDTINFTKEGNTPTVCKEPPPSTNAHMLTFAIQRVFVNQMKRCVNLSDIATNLNSSFDNVTVCSDLTDPKLAALCDWNLYCDQRLKFQDLVISPEDLLNKMDVCGQEALDIAKEYRMENISKPGLVDESVSFNWNRCAFRTKKNQTKAKEVGDQITSNLNQLLNPFADVSYLNPDVQTEQARNTWKQSQQEIYCSLVTDSVGAGMTLAEARLGALEKSITDADGFEDCSPNAWAGAWFWFTVMTTIGYGNTAPETDGARTMVFTLGFLSILLFAAVLAKAGSIVNAIVEDFLRRSRLTFLTRNWIKIIIWGALYYLWSLLIASYYIHWSLIRLDEEVSYKDAYWFAYITTTTVGLGDYYLEHAVLIGIDLLIWPLLILFGFVLLASFLTALKDTLVAVMPNEEAEFADTLDDIPVCPSFCKSKRGSSDPRPGYSSGDEQRNEPLADQNREKSMMNTNESIVQKGSVDNAVPVANNEESNDVGL